MFNLVREMSKKQITEDTIRNYFNAKKIKMTIKFTQSCTFIGIHKEKIEVPFIIDTVGGGQDYLPSYNEIFFNTTYISNNYPNTIAFCMQVEDYLKEHPDFNKTGGLPYALGFMIG